jgi:hypothetical protein
MIELFGAIVVIGAFLAVIALMPEFDGWGEGDWEPPPPPQTPARPAKGAGERKTGSPWG